MIVDFSKEAQGVVYRLQTISTTLEYISEAYANFYAYSFGEIPFENDRQRKKTPLSFYRMYFQFFFTIQLCKLYENASGKENAISSLITLNEKLKNKYSEYHTKYEAIIQDIEDIKNSVIYKKLKDLRDKAYAHSDKHKLNTPLKFIYLTEDETIQLKTILIKSIEIYNNCYNIYGLTYVFNHVYESSVPKNLLANSFHYKDFFYKHARSMKLIDASRDVKSLILLLRNEDDKLKIDLEIQRDALKKLLQVDNLIEDMLDDAYRKK